jgi:hypothetical protein
VWEENAYSVQNGFSKVDIRIGVIHHLSSTNTVAILPFASEHRHKMSTRISTLYKHVKEHYPISKKHGVAREYHVETPCLRRLRIS